MSESLSYDYASEEGRKQFDMESSQVTDGSFDAARLSILNASVPRLK